MRGGHELGREALRQIREGLKKIDDLPQLAHNAIDRKRGQSVISSGFPVRNDSGEVIPPYGIMKPSSFMETVGDEPFHSVSKPDLDTARFYLVNGETEIPIHVPGETNGYGTGYILNRPFPALYDPEVNEAGPPRIGEFWSPTDGSWKLTKSADEWGFYCVSTDGPEDTAPFMQQVSLPCITLKASLTADMCADTLIATLENVRAILENIHRIPPASLPSEAFNDARHAGQAGDDVWLHFDGQRKNSSGSAAPGWYVFDVTGKEDEFVHKMRFNPNTCCFEALNWKIRFESCEPKPTEWEVIENGCGEEC